MAENEPEMLARIRMLSVLHAHDADALGGHTTEEIPQRSDGLEKAVFGQQR